MLYEGIKKEPYLGSKIFILFIGVFLALCFSKYLNSKKNNLAYEKSKKTYKAKKSEIKTLEKNPKYEAKKSENKIIEIINNTNSNIEDKIIEILHNKNNLKSKNISKYLDEFYNITICKKDLNRGILKKLKKEKKIYYNNEKYEYYVK